ncbi:MAG TPA: DUF5652 family protein [Candidatus Paceibacterota bacterium]
MPWAFGVPFVAFGIVMAVLLVWSIVWKGLALWAAARDGSKVWFVVLLILNTAGILEILYLYVFRKGAGDEKGEAQK